MNFGKQWSKVHGQVHCVNHCGARDSVLCELSELLPECLFASDDEKL